MVKGDPSNRRRFLDELLVSLVPRHAATRSDYDRVLKQRNALLKSARAGKFTAGHEATLDVWDQHMARAGAELLHARLELVERLRPPHLNSAYAQLTDGSKDAGAVYRSTIQGVLDDDGGRPSRERSLRRRLMTFGCCPLMNLQSATSSLRSLQEKGTRTRYLLGRSAPRRTGTRAGAGPPAKGYASHGETWSMCLSLRLASYYVMLDDARTGALRPSSSWTMFLPNSMSTGGVNWQQSSPVLSKYW